MTPSPLAFTLPPLRSSRFEIVIMTTHTHTLSARSCRIASQVFNLGSMFSVLIPVPFVILWFGASMVAYAHFAHHPDPRVIHYNKIAGYRFYGWAGTLPVVLILSDTLAKLVGGTLKLWLLVWASGVLVMIPLGLRDWLRSGREEWKEMTVEIKQHHA
jgi:hypothetical protein